MNFTMLSGCKQLDYSFFFSRPIMPEKSEFHEIIEAKND